jgi:hypothetical protein
VVATLNRMGKKKQPPGDRHKPRRLVGVSERICLALEELGAIREAKLTEMVRIACIEYLEKHNSWPPKKQ